MSLYLSLFDLGLPTIQFLHYAKMEGKNPGTGRWPTSGTTTPSSPAMVLPPSPLWLVYPVSFRKGKGGGGV